MFLHLFSSKCHLETWVQTVEPEAGGIRGDEVRLRPCLFRSSRCVGLQDKHGAYRGLMWKWSRASPWWRSTADLPVSSPAANVSPPPWLPLCTVHCERAAPQWGNWGWGNSAERVAPYTSGLGGAEKRSGVLELNMQSAPSLWTALMLVSYESSVCVCA